MVLALGAALQMEFDEARNFAEAGIARQPNLLECFFLALENLEAIHCDEHEFLLARSVITSIVSEFHAIERIRLPPTRMQE